jgi:hypothetical protein
MLFFIDVATIICMIFFICVYIYTYIKSLITKKGFCLYLASIKDFELLNLLEKNKYFGFPIHIIIHKKLLLNYEKTKNIAYLSFDKIFFKLNKIQIVVGMVIFFLYITHKILTKVYI